MRFPSKSEGRAANSCGERKGRHASSFRLKRRVLLAVIALCAVCVGGVGYALGAIPGTGGAIHGCYDAGDNLKVVNALPCPKGYTSLVWSQTGPPGEKGATGATELPAQRHR